MRAHSEAVISIYFLPDICHPRFERSHRIPMVYTPDVPSSFRLVDADVRIDHPPELIKGEPQTWFKWME